MSDRAAVLKAALDLPLDERLELVMDLWSSIAPDDIPVTDAQKAILNERLAALSLEDTVPWEAVRRRLEQEFE